MILTSFDFFKTLSAEYNIEINQILNCLKSTLERNLKCGKLFSEFKNNKLYFYEIIYNRFGERRRQEIKIKQNIYQKLLDDFIHTLRKESIRQNHKAIKNIIKQEGGIIEGKITTIKKQGIEVLTRYGYAFCPNQNIFIKDLKTKHFCVDKKMYFHIKKFGLFGKNALILDRKHINILYKEIDEFMGDCGIYHIVRDIGKQSIIFCTKQPNKEQIKSLAKITNTKIRIELRN